jgi:hypothetical protein
MPSIRVVFYQEQEGDAPVIEWLRELNATNSKAFDKCRAAIARLALLGHELRRPEPIICAMASMSCGYVWVRSTTAFSTFFTGRQFPSSLTA